MFYFGLAIALDGAIMVYYGVNHGWSSLSMFFWDQVGTLVGIALVGLGLTLAFERRPTPKPPPRP